MNELFGDKGEEILYRIELLEDELHRIKLFVKDAACGYNLDDILDEDIYQESSQEKSSASSYLRTAMSHVLKLTYSTTNRNHNEWRGTISRSIQDFQDRIYNSNDNPSMSIVNYLNEKFDKIYKDSLKRYTNSAKTYPDLYPNKDLIPDQCPWTLEDFMEMNPDDVIFLVKKLPVPHNFDRGVYMQLFSGVCKFLEGPNLDGAYSNCAMCDNHDKCKAIIDERR